MIESEIIKDIIEKVKKAERLLVMLENVTEFYEAKYLLCDILYKYHSMAYRATDPTKNNLDVLLDEKEINDSLGVGDGIDDLPF